MQGPITDDHMPFRSARGEPRILLVEDDRTSALISARELEQAGMRVDVAVDGVSGLARACEQQHDLVVLDIELPGMNGFEVLRELRSARHSTPVLVLSGRTERQDVVRGLEDGADDYLAKPYCGEELVARIRAILRRELRNPEPVLCFGDLTLDRANQAAQCAGKNLRLTPRELMLLSVLIADAPQLVQRAKLLHDVCGFSFDPGTNVIDVHVSKLRRKLQLAGSVVQLATVRGTGFRLVA